MSGEPQRPKVGVTAMVSYGGRILVGERAGSHAAGQLAFPGGHQEWWKTWQETAVDEAFEETGLVVKPFPRGLENDPYLFVTDNRMEEDQRHYTTVWIPCFPTEHVDPSKPIPGKEPHKCKEWNWLTLDQLIQRLTGKENYTYDDILAQPTEQRHWLPMSRLLQNSRVLLLPWPERLADPPPPRLFYH